MASFNPSHMMDVDDDDGALSALTPLVGWWGWLTTEQLTFGHYVCMSFVVATVMYIASLYMTVNKARQRTTHALRHGAILGVRGVTHVSTSVACHETIAVGRAAAPPVAYVSSAKSTRPTSAPSPVVLVQNGTSGSSAAVPPSALKDSNVTSTTMKKKQASVAWADDVFRIASDARLVSVLGASSHSPSSTAQPSFIADAPSVGNEASYLNHYTSAAVAPPAQPHRNTTAASREVGSDSSSDDSSTAYRKDHSRREASTGASHQRRSSSKDNQRFSRRATARAMRAGKITLQAGNADVMANAALTKTVSPTLIASMASPGPLPPLHVGASAMSTVLDASYTTSGDALTTAPASASFAPVSRLSATTTYGRRSPLYEDTDATSAIYDEDWARRLGCTAPPRRQHRRESLLDVYATNNSNDLNSNAANQRTITQPRYPGGLGVFCEATPQLVQISGHSGTPSRNSSVLQALTGLDFSAVEQPLLPLVARLPTPPPQPAAVQQERTPSSNHGGSFTPAKPALVINAAPAVRGSSLLNPPPRPTPPPSPISTPNASSMNALLQPHSSDVVRKPSTFGVVKPDTAVVPADTIATDAKATIAPPAAPTTTATTSKVDVDGFKVPSPVVRPAPPDDSKAEAKQQAVAMMTPIKAVIALPQQEATPPQTPPQHSASIFGQAPASSTFTKPALRGSRYDDEPTTADAPKSSATALPTPGFASRTAVANSSSAWGTKPAAVPSVAFASGKPAPTFIAAQAAKPSSLFLGLTPQQTTSTPQRLVQSRTAPAFSVAASPWAQAAPSAAPMLPRSRSSSGGSGGHSPRSGGYLGGGGRSGGGSGHHNNYGRGGGGSAQTNNNSARRRQ